jgi:hypothetical protein
MTAVQYALLFRIECLHRYFGGAACRSLTLSPTHDCRDLLARYRMLFRSATGGGAVYGPRQSPADWLRLFDESFPFTFAFTSTDPALDAYTEINTGAGGEPSAFDPSENLFYFDNTSDHTAEVFGGQRLLLHAPGEPFAGAALSVRPKLFDFSSQGSSTNHDLHILEPLSGKVLGQLSAQHGAPIALDLRRLPEGHYLLAMDGQELLKVYLSNRPPAQLWGAVSIYLGGVSQSVFLPAACQTLDERGNVSPKTFTIALDSRKTIWRYYIIDPAGKQNFGHYELTGATKRSATPETGAAPEIRFRRLSETTPVGGRTAWVFESQSPMPLLQAPGAEFLLTLRPSGNGKRGERPIPLPYARGGSLAKTGGGGAQPPCSEVFVYV